MTTRRSSRPRAPAAPPIPRLDQDEIETMVACPTCRDCQDCGGKHMVPVSARNRIIERRSTGARKKTP